MLLPALPVVAAAAAAAACPPPPAGPNYPPAGGLSRCSLLPDPFLRADGTRAGHGTWEQHKADAVAMLEHYMYGHSPPPAEVETAGVLTGTADLGYAELRNYTLRVGKPSSSDRVAFDLFVYLPAAPAQSPTFVFNADGIGYYNLTPVFVFNNDFNLGDSWLAEQKESLLRRGYAIAEFNRTQLRVDQKTGPSGHSPDGVQKLYPEYDWGTIAVWAWGGSRVTDFMLSDPVLRRRVDADRVMAMGHSRGGKTALWQAVLDDRVSVTLPLMSGEGGCGALRFRTDNTTETIAQITENFPYWFHPNFHTFAGNETLVPWDQHLQRSLVAPRAQIGFNGFSNQHENPRGSQATWEAARVVYKWMGVPERIGIHFHAGAHPMNDQDYVAVADFADFVFYGKAPRNSSEFSSEPYALPETRSWSAPSV